MLAQGPPVTLYEFSEDWRDAKVQGAGEIIVDHSARYCAYSITDTSGTYKPNDIDSLKRVAFTFTRALEDGDGNPVPPEYIMNGDEAPLPFDWNSSLRGNEKAGALTCP